MKDLAYVDDSKDNLDSLSLMLETSFNIETFQDPFKFLNVLVQKQFNAILLDVHMPLLDGFGVFERIVNEPNYNGCPIFLLSSDETESNRLKSFEFGAVDFIGRSMMPEELIARVESKIIYFEKNSPSIELASLKLDLNNVRAYYNNIDIRLTLIEFKILFHLLKMFPEIISKESLVRKVWGNISTLDSTIYTHIYNLNSKFKNWKYEIVIERGKGMRLLEKN
jgi:DNA-binding response OmpR family regulator